MIDPDEIIFVHDKAPCIRTYPTQHLLQNKDIWTRFSSEFNVAEHIGAITKDEVKKKMMSDPRHSHYHEETLKMHISSVLKNLGIDSNLFETLPCSYPSRLRTVKEANGRHTNY